MESFSKTFDLSTGETTSTPFVRSAEEVAAEAARTAHLVECEEIRLRLVADLSAQPVGVQVFFRATADVVRGLLLAGNVAAAREVIATTPLHGDEALESVRATMLSRFPQ